MTKIESIFNTRCTKAVLLDSSCQPREMKGPPVLQWTADGTGGLQKIAHNASFIISQHWKLLAAPVQSIYCPKSLATVKKVPFHLEIQGIATFGRNWTNC